MEKIYTKKHTANISSPAKTESRQSASVPSNSAMLAYMDYEQTAPNADFENQLKTRMMAQIPSAEAEADRLSASVTGGSPEAVRQKMQAKTGADFSGVRFHTGAEAASKADSMGARAYTKGADIYFGSGGFDPTIAAHELVHTAQQGAASGGVDTMDVQAGTVQMWPWSKKKPGENPHISSMKMGFGRAAYRKDKDYQGMKSLIKAYNADKSADNEAALMNAAMDYIEKNSTGETARHKGRTANAENILYQLTMRGGATQDAAMKNINRLGGDKIGRYDNDEKIKEDSRVRANEALNNIGAAVQGTGGFSPALQMIAAEVMANQDKTRQLNAGYKSDASRKWNGDRTNYDYVVNTNSNEYDQSYINGTTFHEFTHVAAGESYKNTDMLVTADKNTSAEGYRSMRTERYNRMKGIKETAPKKFEKFVDGRALYATSDKTSQQYAPNFLDKVDEEAEAAGLDQRSNGAYAKRLGEEVAGISRIRDAFKDEDVVNKANYTALGQRRAQVDKQLNDITKPKTPEERKALNEEYKDLTQKINYAMDNTSHTDTLVEYDSVLNQMLMEEEFLDPNRDSEHYRKLKAAALRAHVDRHNAKRRQQK